MKAKKQLTVIYNAHENPGQHIDYLNVMRNKIDAKIDIIFSYDNPLDKAIKSKIDEDIVIIDGSNKGKMLKILSVIPYVDTSWYKIIDNDDILNFEDINLLEKKLHKIDTKSSFPLHTAAKISKESIFWGVKTSNKHIIEDILKESSDVNWCIEPNAKAIYNTAFTMSFFNEFRNLKRMNYFDDDFFSALHQLFFDKKHIKLRPYIQYHRLGQSSDESKWFDAINVLSNLIVMLNVDISEEYKLNSRFDIETFIKTNEKKFFMSEPNKKEITRYNSLKSKFIKMFKSLQLY